ncbi:hypothetical protein GQ53DRAFT_326731 [Thozetella sp. PMI_491]|nr:hypothetical protein GQ53DRAFT_326731 [Thozetella sp. PMI_491]
MRIASWSLAPLVAPSRLTPLLLRTAFSKALCPTATAEGAITREKCRAGARQKQRLAWSPRPSDASTHHPPLQQWRPKVHQQPRHVLRASSECSTREAMCQKRRGNRLPESPEPPTKTGPCRAQLSTPRRGRGEVGRGQARWPCRLAGRLLEHQTPHLLSHLPSRRSVP